MNMKKLQKFADECAEWEARQVPPAPIPAPGPTPVEFEFKRSDDTEGGTCD